MMHRTALACKFKRITGSIDHQGHVEPALLRAWIKRRAPSALLKHVDARFVLAVNHLVVLTLIDKPQKLKVNRLKQTLANVWIGTCGRVEDNLRVSKRVK